jgi:hypothetical protein
MKVRLQSDPFQPSGARPPLSRNFPYGRKPPTDDNVTTLRSKSKDLTAAIRARRYRRKKLSLPIVTVITNFLEVGKIERHGSVTVTDALAYAYYAIRLGRILKIKRWPTAPASS